MNKGFLLIVLTLSSKAFSWQPKTSPGSPTVPSSEHSTFQEGSAFDSTGAAGEGRVRRSAFDVRQLGRAGSLLSLRSNLGGLWNKVRAAAKKVAAKAKDVKIPDALKASLSEGALKVSKAVMSGNATAALEVTKFVSKSLASNFSTELSAVAKGAIEGSVGKLANLPPEVIQAVAISSANSSQVSASTQSALGSLGNKKPTVSAPAAKAVATSSTKSSPVPAGTKSALWKLGKPKPKVNKPAAKASKFAPWKR